MNIALKTNIANIIDLLSLKGTRLGRFRVVVTKIPEQKLVFAKITYKGIEWARALNTDGILTIRFYPHPIQDYWEFNFYESFKVLVIARNAISELNN